LEQGEHLHGTVGGERVGTLGGWWLNRRHSDVVFCTDAPGATQEPRGKLIGKPPGEEHEEQALEGESNLLEESSHCGLAGDGSRLRGRKPQ